MRILLAGATGFIGSRLARALRQRGHEVTGVSRRRPASESGSWVELDIGHATAQQWSEALRGIDVVINAVGIFTEGADQRFEALHDSGPRRLFDACVASGVARVVQVSALGADDGARTAYHLSKRAADMHLLSLPIDSVVVQPSLVFGLGGASARAFLTWACLPLLPLPAGGMQPVQPVHVDDVVEALVVLTEAPWPGAATGRVALVGPRVLTLAEYLQQLRHAVGLRSAAEANVPAWAMRIAARIGDHMSASLLDSDSWSMLQAGNTADPLDITRLLGRTPRPVSAFIDADVAPALRRDALIEPALTLLRWSIAVVWIVTAIVSFGIYPVDDSLDLLARSGVPELLRWPMLMGAAASDLALGVLTLLPWRGRHWLWVVQAGLIVFYTAVITLRLPEFWVHPYGPVLKNLPMLAVLAVLWVFDRERIEGAAR